MTLGSKKDKQESKDATSSISSIRNTMISNTYDVVISGLHEVVSRWILHITTSEDFLPRAI